MISLKNTATLVFIPYKQNKVNNRLVVRGEIDVGSTRPRTETQEGGWSEAKQWVEKIALWLASEHPFLRPYGQSTSYQIGI